MSDRLRGVLLGIVLGVAPLLLLDLAQQLGRAGPGSRWWSLAAYGLVGAVAASTALLGRRDGAVPVTAALVLLVAALPALVGAAPGWLPRLPVVAQAAERDLPLVVALIAVAVTGTVRARR